jgi:hypothetical protein
MCGVRRRLAPCQWSRTSRIARWIAQACLALPVSSPSPDFLPSSSKARLKVACRPEPLRQPIDEVVCHLGARTSTVPSLMASERIIRPSNQITTHTSMHRVQSTHQRFRSIVLGNRHT